jgi:hypothetical protein
MKQRLLAAGLFVVICAALVPLHAATASLRMLTQNVYLPGLPVLVRLEAYAPDGSRDRETWDVNATLSASGGVTLSTNVIALHNGVGSALVAFTGGGNFNLTATVGGVAVTRSLQTGLGTAITKVGGTLSGGSGTWSGIVNVTSDVIVTNYTLTIQSNTLVLIDGVGSGTNAADIIVNANGSIQSLGTELHPVTITCSNQFFTNRWGQIRHNSSLPSLYRHTFIHRAGRAPGEGHTGQAPAVRPSGTTLTFESCTISDLCETTSGAPGFGTPAKVMYAVNSSLTFNDCLFQRVRTGPEIDGTALLMTNCYTMETRGPDDSDGIYLHGQQVGQTIKLVDSVFALGDDDGIDTLGSTITVENCLLRGWASTVEDAKAISAFNGVVNVHHCLITDSTVGIAAKANAGTPARVNLTQSTLVGNLTNVIAAYKANAPGPIIDFRITNCVLSGGNPIHSDFEPTSPTSTNFIIVYTDTGEPWAGTGNINSDPLFVDEALKNFRLRIGSPCIDAGNPASPPDADATITDMGYFPFLTNPNPLIAFGSAWRYLDNGTDQGTNWSLRIFDDSLWSNGLAQLGYSSNPAELDEATIVSYGPDANNKYITTYFRRPFTVLNPSEFTNVEARVLIDDGAVVYLNGQEIFRPNMLGGGVSYLTLAGGSGENTLFTNSVSPLLLLTGTNVIAVEVHQFTNTSSDISFDFELVGFRGQSSGMPMVAITAPTNGASFLVGANITIDATATDGDGTITNVQFYQNNAFLDRDTTAPYSINWNGVAMGSYSLTAIATDNAGNSRTSAPVNITVANPATTTTNTLVALGSTWRYLDNGTDQGTNWSQRSFDDTGWGSGAAPLGYCTSGCTYGIVTTVSFGPNAGNKYPTTYFRRAFNVDDPSRVQSLRLNLLRDDGAVVYINGFEVWRTNMPFGTISYLTYAPSASNYSYEQNNLPSNAVTALVTGTNVLAVEIHQGTPGSTDIAMEARLDAVINAATNQRPIVNITAPANNSTYSAPLTTTITANATDIDGTVTNVSFYTNSAKLTEDTNAPYSAAWNSVPAGTYSLFAVAIDNVGLASTSAIVNVAVSTNTAPPIVFNKTPVPGNVTNLAQITVTFSKAVQGVDAGDLLINGMAATNVTGSGSNYTFIFAQPAYGPVAITWASGHGITDTFTPAAPFNTNSAGANWQYQLLDVVPPTITTINPVPNSTIAALTSIAITFSEPITGVNASDLLVNSAATTSLSGSGPGPYVFSFAQPTQGVVQVSWAGASGIQDASGNPFSPAPWSYTLDTNTSGVVISEIMYHPASENVLEEYIELFNKGAGAVGLNGWRFSAGIDFTFSNVTIPAGGYLVVAADLATFTNKYPTVTNVVGNWTGVLRNDGEDIDLDDASGNRVDSVRFADEGDWATRQRGPLDLGHRGWVWLKPHDGGGASLELINPSLSNNNGQNWRPSTVTNGTPGRVNSVYQNNVAPLILEVTHFPTIPTSSDQPTILARILDEAAGGFGVNLFWRVDGAASFTNTPMHDDGLNGDSEANDTLWTARIPAQANNAVIEFYVSATDAQNNTRTWPAPAIASLDGVGPTGQVVNALFQIDNTVYAPTNAQPLYKMIMTGAENTELAQIPAQSNTQGPNSQMNGTFISIDGGGIEHHYNVGIRNRGHGSRTANPPNYRVNFRSDDPWKGVVGLNFNAVQVHIQHFGSTIARKSGAVGGATYAAQVRVNNVNRAASGAPMFGSYAAVEVIDSDFAQAHYPLDSEGNLYRAVRDINPPDFAYRTLAAFPGLYGPENKNSYTNTWFKLNNASEDDWTDLIGMLRVMGVNNSTPFTTANVRQVVNVEQWIRHLAVMNLLGNSESGLNSGFNDDYNMYRGANDPRFELIFWDLDQTLGQGGSFGATSGLFTMSQNNGSGLAFDRFINWPEFLPIYYRTLYEVLTTSMAKTSFDALINATLGGYVPPATINAIISWMDTRRSFVLGQIPASALYNSNAPVAAISGVPRSPTPMTSASLTVGGSSVVSYQFSLNGGAYSAETPIATSINLSSLANGPNTVAVVAKGTNGVWQEFSNATVVAWVVNTSVPSVRLNEVLARNVSAVNHFGTFPDTVELWNEGAANVDISGLRLSDDPGQPNKFTFAPGTVLGPGSNLVVFANNSDGTPGIHLGFSLDADGDSLRLFDRVSNGGAQLDSVKFGRQLADFSIGRISSSGEWQLTQPTFGSANIAASLGNERNLRINEWLAASGSQNDFIELYNSNALPVALGGLYLTDNLIGWPSRNRIDDLSFIGAGEFVAFIADGDGNGRDHLNFSLALERGEIGLFTRDLSAIDCIIYGPQQPDVSQGKCPNGGAAYTTLATPTPGAPNTCPLLAPPPQTITLVRMDDFWRYDASGNDLGVAWSRTNYDDSAWPQGRGVLGYDNGNNPLVQSLTNTVLPLTTPGGTMIITYYFRTYFNFPGATTPTSLVFTNLMDDGVVVYLNEQEVYRLNMPNGPVTASSQAFQNAESTSFTEVVVPMTNNFLVPGTNLLAVELHQFGTAPDVNMGLAINAIIVTNSPAAAGVLINEVLANNSALEEPDGSKPDWVELYNPSTTPVDLGDMSLTDDTTMSRRWIFPAGMILNGQSFLRVRCDGDLPASGTNTGFALKANGGAVYLFNRIADGGSLLSSIAYGLQAADYSIGRIPNGSSNWVLTIPTLGAGNLPATLGNPLLLKINEWMANPSSGDDYFEIYNPNVQPVDISRFYLTDILTTLTKHRLPALSFIGVGQDAFQKFVADGNTTAGADHVNFSLKAGGEDLGLTSSNNVYIDGLSFGSQTAGVSQGLLPDGAATVVNFTTTPTPGKSNFLPLDNVVVNEVLTHTDAPLEDAVEFYNPSGDDVDISGWYLSDSQNNLLKYRVPTNTVVPAHGFTVLYESRFNSDLAFEAFSFSSAKGDEVYLSQSTNAGVLTGYRAYATFGAAENGVSFGRFLTSLGYDFTAMSAHTFGVSNPATTNDFEMGTGATNAYAKVGPVVINEIMYHPAVSNDALEFVELRNVTGAAVPLYDTNNPANTWRLRKGIDFNFASGTSIPAGGYLVVVSFDPLADPTALASFQSTYGTNMTLAGPYSGKLDNNGEEIELRKPDAPQADGFVPYIVADHVTYGDAVPWPSSPDGSGDALKKTVSNLYGNEPLNWVGGMPTPGAANFVSASNNPPVLDTIADRSVHVGYPVTFTATASDPDLPAQSLTFSLDAPVPAGASIGFGTGTFTWTPATNQGPVNYSITVRVTDTGSPAMSDTKIFTLAVLRLPQVSSVQITNGMVRIEWESYAGRRYRVETATTLTNPAWTQVGSDIVASGTTASLIILGGTDAQRFYRVVSYDN